MGGSADDQVRAARLSKLKKDQQAKEFELLSATEIVKKTEEDMQRIGKSLVAILELIEAEESGA